MPRSRLLLVVFSVVLIASVAICATSAIAVPVPHDDGISAVLTHWLNTKSDTRHNSRCRYFKKTKQGRLCGPDEGKACKICGG